MDRILAQRRILSIRLSLKTANERSEPRSLAFVAYRGYRCWTSVALEAFVLPPHSGANESMVYECAVVSVAEGGHDSGWFDL